MVHWLCRGVAALATGALFAAAAATAEPFVEGKDYELITPPIKVGSSDEVVVTEFFWYGCGHCYTFESMLNAWAGKLPEGARVDPSPTTWNPSAELHARAYFVAKALNALDSVHEKVFEAMHLKRQRLGSKAQIRDLFVANGVDGDAFDSAWDSFGVNNQIRLADSRIRSARVAGTPSMMVNGKYRIETRMTRTQAGMLDVAAFLVEKELAEIAERTNAEVSMVEQ